MKCGFCTILGRPNVGKSTLINALLSKKVSIVTPKAQTTRDDVIGVYNEKDLQIVFIDTPGIFEGSEALYKKMNKASRKSLADVDVIIYMVDSSTKSHDEDVEILSSIHTDKPLIIVFNKIDLATADMMIALKNRFDSLYPNCQKIEISALTNFGLKDIKEAVKERLKDSLPYYPEGVVTDKDPRFMAKEIIREELLHFLKDEIPHECAVIVNKFSEKKDGCEIFATIVCEKETQKPIIIGKAGTMIKRISMTARRNLERMWGKHVSLRAKVECIPNWRNDERKLQKLGYGDDDEGNDY